MLTVVGKEELKRLLEKNAVQEHTVLLSLITVDTSLVDLSKNGDVSDALDIYNQHFYSNIVRLSTDPLVPVRGITLLERKNFMERIARRSQVLIKQLFEHGKRSKFYFNELRTLVMATPAEEVCNIVSAFLMACKIKAKDGTNVNQNNSLDSRRNAVEAKKLWKAAIRKVDKIRADENKQPSTRVNDILDQLPTDVLLEDSTTSGNDNYLSYFLETVQTQLNFEIKQQINYGYAYLEKVLNMFGKDWDEEGSDAEEPDPSSTTAAILKFPGQSEFKKRLEVTEKNLASNHQQLIPQLKGTLQLFRERHHEAVAQLADEKIANELMTDLRKDLQPMLETTVANIQATIKMSTSYTLAEIMQKYVVDVFLTKGTLLPV